MAFQEVGTGFVGQYYQFFATERAALAGVYGPTSLMTWCGEQIQGVEAIMAKLATLPFQQAQFKLEETDCHPSVSNGVLVVCQGEVMLPGESHSLRFNDVFHLSLEEGRWMVTNQIFRILGGGSV